MRLCPKDQPRSDTEMRRQSHWSIILKKAVGPRNTGKDAKNEAIVEDWFLTHRVRTLSGLAASFRVL